MFDLSITKLLVLGVIAIVIFGPDQLPRIAAQAGRALRDLRRLADGATRDLREGLGPEFAEFDVTDLHPKNFVRKHLMEGFDGDDLAEPPDLPPDAGVTAAVPGGLAPGERPPYDAEAT
ncbi:MAG TPA: sec-independent translocase [Streptosporangiaceae bacterium]